MKQDRFLSLMAIGDAFGMKYEFVEHDQTATSADLSYGPHPKYTEYQTAHYTDDTQMSLANAKVLLAFKENLNDITADDFIAAWLEQFKADPRLGYSKYMYGVLSNSKTVEDFKNSLDPNRGHTGGAVMRSAPFGFIDDKDMVKKLSLMQAEITHNTAAGKISAMACALSIYFLRQGGKRESLLDFLDKELGHNWCSSNNGFEDDPHNGLKIFSSALSAFLKGDTLSDVLLTAINQEKRADTDTICAIAMCMSSCCDEIKQDLPRSLIDKIEDGNFGKRYLERFDTQFLKAFPQPPKSRLRANRSRP